MPENAKNQKLKISRAFCPLKPRKFRRNSPQGLPRAILQQNPKSNLPNWDLASEMPPKGPKTKYEKLGIAPPYKKAQFCLAMRDPAPRGRAREARVAISASKSLIWPKTKNLKIGQRFVPSEKGENSCFSPALPPGRPRRGPDPDRPIFKPLIFGGHPR